jgi:hypothetical protein
MDNRFLPILRLLLGIGAIGWGISAYGIFMPWPSVLSQLQSLGAKSVPSDPMLIYWLRMTAAAFTFIGILFLVAAINPRKYAAIIPLLGAFMVIEGIILTVFGLALGCAVTFWADSLFCLSVGAAITVAHIASRSRDAA